MGKKLDLKDNSKEELGDYIKNVISSLEADLKKQDEEKTRIEGRILFDKD